MKPDAPRPRRPWLLPLIFASIAVLLGAGVLSHTLVAGAFESARSASSSPTPSATSTGPAVATDDQPLRTGPSGSPVAVEPVACPGACFDGDSILGLTMDEWDFGKLGLPEPDLSDDERKPVAVADLGSSGPVGDLPAECLFAASGAPSSLTGGDLSSLDQIFRTATFVDLEGSGRAEQWARLFSDSSSAEAYMTSLASSIDACASVSSESATVVTAAPALDVPESVAVVGWVQTAAPGAGWREYVFDAQSANGVIRLRLVTDGSVTEERFRSAVQSYLRQVQFNVPRPGDGMVG